MASKKFNREQMQHCVGVLDELAKSGLSTQDFAQAQGVSFGQLRAWQSHAPRWREQLADSTCPAPARCQPTKRAGFVQVKAADPHPPTHPAQRLAMTEGWASVRIDCSQGARSVVLHWPSEAPVQCAQWLKAYLA